MKDSTKNKVEGAAHQVKGKVKEEAGRTTGDAGLQTKGKAEKVGGKVQKKADKHGLPEILRRELATLKRISRSWTKKPAVRRSPAFHG